VSVGNIGGTFSIDRTLGIISINQPMDPNTLSEFTLTVRASDAGTPSLSSTAVVRIEQTMASNMPPKFDQEEYVAEVSESVVVGAFVAVVRARCASSVVYRIVDGNGDGLFSIDPSAGLHNWFY